MGAGLCEEMLSWMMGSGQKQAAWVAADGEGYEVGPDKRKDVLLR